MDSKELSFMVLLSAVCVRVWGGGARVQAGRWIALREIKAFWLALLARVCIHHSSKTPYNSLIEWEGDFYDMS